MGLWLCRGAISTGDSRSLNMPVSIPAQARGRLARATIAGVLASTIGCATSPAREFAVAARRDPEAAAWVRGVPYWRAQEPTGLSAAVGMALARWGRGPARGVCGAEVQGGSPESWLRAVEREFARRGLWAHVSQGDVDDLRARLRAGVPVIVALSEEGGRRFVLVTGCDDRSRRLLCHDGNARPRVMGLDDFEGRWRAAGKWQMVICPPEAATWPLSLGERFGRARHYSARRHYEQAVRDLEAACQMAPRASAPLVEYGNVRRAMGQPDEAEQLYREALRLNPADATARNNLAYLLAEEGRGLLESEELARAAVLQEPGNPAFLDTLGFVLHRQGRHAEAVGVLERARGAAAGRAIEIQTAIALHLALAHRACGQDHLARQVLSDALRQDPGLEVPPELVDLRP